MYSQCASSSSTASAPFHSLPYLTPFSPKNRHRFQPFPAKPRPSTGVVYFSISSSNVRHNKHSWYWSAIRCSQRGSTNHFSEESRSITPSKAGEVSGLPNCGRGGKSRAFEFAVKPVAVTLLWVSLGLCPIKGWQPPATALPAISELIWKKKAKGSILEKETVVDKEHYYAMYTRRLLDKASAVLKAIEEARVSNGSIHDVKKALNDLKSTKREIEYEIDCELDAWQKELKSVRKDLVKKSERAANYVFSARSQQEWLHMKQDLAAGGGGNEALKLKTESLEKLVDRGVKEFDMLENKFEDLEDQVRTRVYNDWSVLLAELVSIERESQRLVDRFIKDMEPKPDESVSKTSTPELARFEIKKDLEAAQKEHLKQSILPRLVEEEEDSSLDIIPVSSSDQVDSTLRIKLALESSKNLQRELEAQIRKDMKKYGDEKRSIETTSEEETVKGFPELEMKWKFGSKEIVVPKAVRVLLFHGWKKWREERKDDLKRKLLEDVDLGKEYVNQKKERIVLDRDRVMSKTVFNEDKRRWEIDPVAVPYAVSKNLIEYARIRHDWGVMYIVLKGDDKEYFIDIQDYEILFEDFGGFDGLYLKMVASGIPISVQVMPIPVTELTLYQQILIAGRFAFSLAYQFWKTKTISSYKDYFIDDMKIIVDDALMRILFPLVEFVIPYSARIMIGMAWPEEIGQTVGTPWYLKWQSETEMRFRSRRAVDSFSYIKIFVRCAIYGYVFIHVIQLAWYMKKKAVRVLGFGPRFKNPNIRTKRQLIAIRRVVKKLIVRRKKFGVNPIKTAFENMKRVRNPPIPLRDFTTIESMREEINEVVTFLQNPNAYQKLGARAPKGVLIVGEMGSGKTSLALAVAAEARVPVVKVEPEQLEAGLWVGQSAANIRELFQTARELAPVIIFVEDFDRFAGVRGKFIHTKKQDHEAFINQLLVELDGFEKQDGVVLMATTRNLSQIDPALKRPGRMDRIFNLTRPTQAEREKILWLAAKETMDPDIVDSVNWSKVAEKTANLFPVDLKRVPVALEGSAFRSKFLDRDELLSYCGWFATFSWIVPTFLRRLRPVRKISSLLVNHLGLALTKEDLQDAVDLMEPYGQISNGIEYLNPPVDWTRETKLSHAVWAAGRGLTALLLPNFDMVDNIWLEPLSWEGIGCTKITKREDEGSGRGNVETISYLEKKLVFCFGSHVASQMLLPFGEETFLSMSELKQAQEIATRMVLQYGWGPDDSPAIYFHGNAVPFSSLITALSMGNQYEFEVASKVEKMYDLAYDKAKEMLRKNRQALEKIVEELLEFEALSGKELEKIIDKNGGVREKEPFSLSRGYESESASVSYLAGGKSYGTAYLGAAN
ncbi:hypothetical protein V2J09_023658 [Rumex salicifolius]